MRSSHILPSLVGGHTGTLQIEAHWTIMAAPCSPTFPLCPLPFSVPSILITSVQFQQLFGTLKRRGIPFLVGRGLLYMQMSIGINTN